jgi:alpha-mannosidase
MHSYETPKCCSTWFPRGMGVLLLVGLAAGAPAGAEDEPLPGFCKEVLILHHSHFDVGFTHPQPVVWELQKEFIDQALGMLDATAGYPEASRPRWTCEVTEPLLRWVATASPTEKERLARYVRTGRLGISAWQYNTTPLCSAEELARQLYGARRLREQLGAKINTAHVHDVTGLPWTVVDLLLDADVELLVMGINLHLGGTPMPRPMVYRWKGPGGREILVMNGEHYSMFDQWTENHTGDVQKVREGLGKYLRHLESMNYPLDFIYLTATCAPHAYDNSPPNHELPGLVRQWNEKGLQPRLRFVTPEELLARIKKIPRDKLPLMAGDWTDYWNFGAGSSAVETCLTRRAKSDLAALDLLQAFRPSRDRLPGLVQQAWNDVTLYDEHTWGAAGSLNHDAPGTTTQWYFKAQPAHEAFTLAGLALARKLDALADNPDMARKQEGVLIVNPSPWPYKGCVAVPNLWGLPGRRIITQRTTARQAGPVAKDTPLLGPVKVPAFGWINIPLPELKKMKPADTVAAGPDFIESPTHRLTFDAKTGRITGLLDKARQWQAVDNASQWGFFQLVHEKPDPKVEPNRKAFHVRSVVEERFGRTGWKTAWKAEYTSLIDKVECSVEKSAGAATLVIRGQAEGVTNLEQRVTLRGDSPLVELTARFVKQDVRSPESLYFVFPLNLPADWRCHFDTAAIPTELDAEQMPGTCRDWVTVDSYVAMHQGDHGATLYCPDAPLVQAGGFFFGRKQDAIPRNTKPLLAAWALNNYWETNFRSSQPGTFELRYAFGTHGAFDAYEAAQTASHVVNPPRVHPAMRCAERSHASLVQVSGPGVATVSVKPADDGQGIIVRLVNLGRDQAQAELTIPGRALAGAWVCSTQEENRTPLAVQGSTARCPLQPRRLTTVRLK